MSSTLSITDCRWDRHQVAEFFGVEDTTVRSYEKLEGFPAPFRFNKKGKDSPFWFPDEVIAWAKKFREKRRIDEDE